MMKNPRLISMLVSILLIGITLFSLGISYINYKDDIVEFNIQREAEQEMRAEENRKLEEEAGHIVWNLQPDDFDLNPTRDLDEAFKTKLFVHLGIIAFILLAEIGLLVVLPKTNKN